jgi:hypothetical protein
MLFLIFFLLSSTKSENRRVEQVQPRGDDWHQWEGCGKRKKEGE